MNLDPQDPRPRVFAFYYPQFHDEPLNDQYYGKGFTEWNLVRQAEPQFYGHVMPRRPGELGYYNLADPTVYLDQVSLAQEAGLEAFCFYHYWFTGGKRLLQTPLDNVIRSDVDFPFFIMWANHDWKSEWRGRNVDLMCEMTYAHQDPEDFICDSLSYFCDERYVCVDNRRLLMIYDIDSIPSLEDYVYALRSASRKYLATDLFVVGIQRYPFSAPIYSPAFDAICEFPPHGYNDVSLQVDTYPPELDPRFFGKIYDYDKLRTASIASRNLAPGIRYIRTIFPDWDNTARRMTGRDPSIFFGSSPEAYRDWLAVMLSQARLDEWRLPIVMVNAWNEWGEAAYLEPDVENGSAWLEATRAAVLSAAQTAVAARDQLFEPVGSLQPRSEIVKDHGVLTQEHLTSAPKHRASLWISQVDQLRAPLPGVVLLASRKFSLRGFLVHKALRRESADRQNLLSLVAEDGSAYRIALPGRNRTDLLAKHTYLDSSNVAGAGFDTTLDLNFVPPGVYQIRVDCGEYGAVHGTRLRVIDGAQKRIRRSEVWENLGLRRAMFLHIQKTGGTLLVSLAREAKYAPVLSHADCFRASNADIERAPFVSGHFGFDFMKRYRDDRYAFTIVRDPVERVVSLYNFCKSRPRSEMPLYDICADLSFDEFVRSELPIVKEHLDNHITWSLSVGRANSRDLLPWEVPVAEQLEMAIANLPCFDRVVILDDEGFGLDIIAAELGITGSVPHINSSGPRSTPMSQSTEEVLVERLRADIELYNLISTSSLGS